MSREASHRQAPMPHERDERAGTPPPGRDPDIRQAYKDLESGQADTDLRGSAGKNFDNAGKRK